VNAERARHRQVRRRRKEPDRREGGFCRFMAYDQGLGHGGPPLVDALLDAAQARALRRGLRRAARNAAKGRE
jgi:hypothetical protein